MHEGKNEHGKQASCELALTLDKLTLVILVTVDWVQSDSNNVDAAEELNKKDKNPDSLSFPENGLFAVTRPQKNSKRLKDEERSEIYHAEPFNFMIVDRVSRFYMLKLGFFIQVRQECPRQRFVNNEARTADESDQE